MTHRTIRPCRRLRPRQGSSLIEVAIATVIIAIVAISAGSFYSLGRISEIREFQRENAMYVVERDIEAFHAEGYGALANYSTPALPYGYNADALPADRVPFPRTVTFDGAGYVVTAQLVFNQSTAGSDYRWQDAGGGLTWNYRRIVVQATWGSGSLFALETRIAQ